MQQELRLLFIILRHMKGADRVKLAALNIGVERESPVYQVVLTTQNQIRATGWFSTADAAFANADEWEVAR